MRENQPFFDLHKDKSKFESKDSYIQGEKKENVIASTFLNKRWMVKLAPKGSRYDLIIDKDDFHELVEIKNEDKQKFRNICIEVHQRLNHKPSGISISDSTIFIHTFGNQIILYDTQEMKWFLKNNQMDLSIYFQEKFNKADNENGGYILPINLFLNKDWFNKTILDFLGEDKFFQILKIIRSPYMKEMGEG